MFTVITCMFTGVLIGFLIRKKRTGGVQHVVTLLIWLLLFLLGAEVGADKNVVGALHSLGLEALGIALVATTGSALAACALWRSIETGRKEEKK